jgi:hypothetical protein
MRVTSASNQVTTPPDGKSKPFPLLHLPSAARRAQNHAHAALQPVTARPHRGAAQPAPRRQRHPPPPPPLADGDLGAPRAAAAAAAARGRARQQRARRHPDGPARRGLVPVLLPGRARRPQRGAPARVQVVLQVLDQGRAVRGAREGGSFSCGACVSRKCR